MNNEGPNKIMLRKGVDNNPEDAFKGLDHPSKKTKENAQNEIKKFTKRNWLAYSPDLAKILNSVKAGIFLSQLIYWHGKGADSEKFYKTIKELKEETELSKGEQYRAQKICEKKDLIEVTYDKIPPKRHYKIKIKKIKELLKGID
ncbi:MAG: hypothetical protein ACQEP3_00660 [Patescibacteria group bacterium]